MILILSKAQNELSTNKLVDTLNYYKANFLRVNGKDIVKPGNFNFELGDHFYLHGRQIDLNNINVVFNRRWYDDEDFNLNDFFSGSELDSYTKEVKGEFSAISQYFFSKLSKALWVPEVKTINKITVLEKAKTVGLKIPCTYIVPKKEFLFRLLDKHQKLITKACGDIWPIRTEDKLLTFLTKRITNNEVGSDNISSEFFPSLIQEEIDKDYEVRIFYFFGELYSMAILSQNDPSTEVDFRNYNHSKLSRGFS